MEVDVDIFDLCEKTYRYWKDMYGQYHYRDDNGLDIDLMES